MKTLSKEIKITGAMTSFVAGIKSISDYYDLSNSLPWIYGISGHAFIMNIHPELCPSGPTAFATAPLKALMKNLGLTVYGTFFTKSDPEFTSKQQSTFTEFQKAIDHDMPSMVWEMNFPEYYLAVGYDDEHYYYHDLRGEIHSKKWDTLGLTDIGIVDFGTPMPMEPPPEDKIAVRQALEFAVKFARHPQDWTYPSYANGIKAYDVWVQSIQDGKANPFGLAYNTVIWSECRQYAHKFLLEAKARLKTDIFDNAIEHYEVVAWSLSKLAKFYPFPPVKQEIADDQTDDALDELFLAREAEKAALAEIKLIIPQL
jgi:hypothetical protein